MSGRLDQRQRHIEELGATRMLLCRMQAVFELPKKIRVAIDNGSIEVAVDLYDDVAPLLRNHGHKVCLVYCLGGWKGNGWGLIQARMWESPYRFWTSSAFHDKTPFMNRINRVGCAS